MIYCQCERKWGTRTNSYTRKNRRGEKVRRKSLYGTYYCPQIHKERVHEDCPRTIGSNKADAIIWEKVCKVIDKPDILIAGANQQIEHLREKNSNAEKDRGRLQDELDTIVLERQWVITQARKGKITDEDMEYQLGALSIQELALKRELATLSEINQLSALEGWESKVYEYFQDLQVGLESLHAAPKTDEERREIFKIKRQVVQTLVERVEILNDRDLKIVFRLNILSLLDQMTEISENKQGETYSRRLTSLVRRRRSAVCG